VFGGLSSERDISIKSGQAVFLALLKEGLDAIEIKLDTEDPSGVKQIMQESSIDVAFIAMHGKFGEDGKLQKILEDMNIDYVGSDSLACSIAMDKIAAKKIFEENNIPVSAYQVLNRHKVFIKKDLKFPSVIKPQSQGSSVGITFVNEPREIDQALRIAFRYDDNVLIEECIKGKEITVGILDNQALEPIEILTKNVFFDFEAKYSTGLTKYVLPASIDSALCSKAKHISLNAHKALGCRHFSRVDLMIDSNNNLFVLELNAIPGFTSTSLLPKAALYDGITFAQLCVRLITLAVKDKSATLNK
jgi:D-alanine-D-alanine ligase